MQYAPHLVALVFGDDAVHVGNAGQREGERGEVIGRIRVVLLQQVQHPAGALGNHFAQGLDATVLDVQDAVRDIEDTVVVRHEDHRGAVLAREVLDQFHHVATRLLVERRRRFVGQHDFRPVHQCPRDPRALLLSAREFGGRLVCVLGKSDPLQHFANPVFLFPGLAVQLQGHLHVLADGEALQQVVCLEDIADLPAHPDERLLLCVQELVPQYADTASLRRA